MTISDLLGPAVVAAAVSGIISVVGVLVNRSTTIRVNEDRLDADRQLAERRFSFDKELAERRLSSESTLAERKFQYERDLHDHKRRVELAEAILADFYQCNDVFREIRSPGSFKSEAENRVRKENETEEESNRKDTYFIPIARIQKNREFLSNLMGRRYRSRAVLGFAVDEAFQQIHEALVKIQVSAGTLSRMAERGRIAFTQNQKLVEECESAIWQSMPGGDPIQPLVQRAIELVEAACRPILEREK
jgi:hypothetical protein